ncbi:hypothetical protein C0Q70_10029 [Pomacea canaliculata]|uniref:Uncharacterized protein n=1 Tax=Pomacea canaliculata TaxID=400727 RepID=A0A2T7PBF6_POMCA|nr:hypothetical protein C0Q70_10029 [Pomacea canaliculata]
MPALGLAEARSCWLGGGGGGGGSGGSDDGVGGVGWAGMGGCGGGEQEPYMVDANKKSSHTAATTRGASASVPARWPAVGTIGVRSEIRLHHHHHQHH